MEVDPLELAQENDDERTPEQRKSRLNNLVAISVAILATFMGLCKVKDDNIVQAMEQMQAKALDEWNFYQARNIREEMAGATVALLDAQIEAAPAPGQAKAIQKREQFQKWAADYEQKKAENKLAAEEAQKRYDELNLHDDQFDLSDAMLAIAISLMALTSLTQKKWLYWLAMVPTMIGLIMGCAGLLSWNIHSDLAARLLGT